MVSLNGLVLLYHFWKRHNELTNKTPCMFLLTNCCEWIFALSIHLPLNPVPILRTQFPPLLIIQVPTLQPLHWRVQPGILRVARKFSAKKHRWTQDGGKISRSKIDPDGVHCLLLAGVWKGAKELGVSIVICVLACIC